ncbi:MAG TPA: glycoside hydrolase family 44 protein, partial [Anaerolinea sp.]|nr:glycoside hydrolase family 44 protein [Anaerolinea sp.]
KDWYYENIPEENPNPAQLPNGSAADRFVQQDQSIGADTILTVPLIGWVAKRRLENHPYDCGFKISKYGAQTATDPYDPDCGSGANTSGDITGNIPTDTSLAVTPQFVKDWVTHLVGVFGSAADGGVRFYNLDNEPMLWNSTHRDVHPTAVSYDELRDRTYQYAAALKQADPTALTLGPVLWGWCAYLYSAADGCSPGADYAAHASTPFVAWYLQQMQAYQSAHSLRILDYLDLHYYPQATGVSLSTAGSAATQSLRLRSTRSLWDPAYIDESWISDTQNGGVAVNLIGRMKAWVSANYPGTRLAITEYNWGGLEDINGALAQADVLGIFGREGLDLATLWDPPEPNQPGAYAFRIYRNYDALGHKFGETSIQAVSADQGRLAVYAAQRNDLALTILVINKTSGDLTSTLALDGFVPMPAAQVYRYSPANLNAITQPSVQSVSPGGFTAIYPANSITLFVIPFGVPLDRHIYLPAVRR